MSPSFLQPLSAPPPTGRRPRWLMRMVMLVLLVFVIFVGFRIVRLGPGELSDRQARRMLGEAAQLEKDRRFLRAIGQYEEITVNTKISAGLRAEAERRLAALYRRHLNNPQAAAAAEARARGLLAGQEGKSRQTPEAGGPDQADDEAGNVIARIGDQTVTLEEILYAWGQFYGTPPPPGEAFESFVRQYLDMVLVGDEARRLGLDRHNRFQFDMRLSGLIALNRLMDDRLRSGIEEPDAETLAAYASNLRTSRGGDRVKLGHIVQEDWLEVIKVREGLEGGESFERLAQEFSLDYETLAEGYVLGEITARDQSIPGFGEDPELVRRLLAHEEGITTGPLESSRGYHWFQVLEKTRGAPQAPQISNEEIKQMVRQQRFARDRAQMLERLQQERDITIERIPLDALGQSAPTTPTTATSPGPRRTVPSISSEASDEAAEAP